MRKKALSARSGEREGPAPQAREGEVSCSSYRRAITLASHLTLATLTRWVPPSPSRKAGGEGL
jgi:hypothetical protein